MSRRLGTPVKLLREAAGHVVTVELKTGEVYWGSMIDCDDNWNCQLEDTVFTHKDGKVSELKHVFVRGSNLRFMILPDMLKNSPIFKRVEPRARGKASTVGVGHGHAVAVHARVKARLRFKRGSRSAADSPPWSCKCGALNLPAKHVVFDIPKLQCDCGELFGGDFSFCIRDIELNGYKLIQGVKQQSGPTCVANAYAAGLEIVKRRKAILRRRNPDLVPEMDARNLWENCEKKCPDLFSEERTIKNNGLHKILHMGLILKKKGIKCSGSAKKYYKPSDVSTIARDDTLTIFTALANGEPLIGSFRTGRRLRYLKYCQIYKSPSKMRQCLKNGKINNHAVVLIGGGMKQGRLFFYFLNSWGKTFCVRRFTRQKNWYGVGKIRASDLSRNLVWLSKSESNGRSLEEQETTQISAHNYVLLTGLSKPADVADMHNDDNDHELDEESGDEVSEQELSDQLI